MADFVHKNNLFEFDFKFYKQISGTAWTENEESLEKFLEHLKFTYEKSKEKINFLDVPIKIQDGRIITDFFCKPTAGHQYLYYDSCHADHITSSIKFSQTI